jgi:predicted dienelactone hydrolase
MAEPNQVGWAAVSVAVLAVVANVVTFILLSGRSDVANLESRLERAINNTNAQIGELKDRDDKRLPTATHLQFKETTDKSIESLNRSVAELLVKREVFERSLADQAVRDSLARQTIDQRIAEINQRIDRQRTSINELVNILHMRPSPPK